MRKTIICMYVFMYARCITYEWHKSILYTINNFWILTKKKYTLKMDRQI